MDIQRIDDKTQVWNVGTCRVKAAFKLEEGSVEVDVENLHPGSVYSGYAPDATIARRIHDVLNSRMPITADGRGIENAFDAVSRELAELERENLAGVWPAPC